MQSKYELISFNKDYIAEADFKLGLSNRAFRYGDGFFETMHANGLEIQFVEDHFLRILAASKILKLELPDYFTLDFLKRQVSGLLSRSKLFQGVRVKLTVYRIGDGFYMPKSNNADIVIEVSYLSKGFYELNSEGIILGIYDEMPKSNTLYSSIKSINAQLYVLAGIYAQEQNFGDVLLLNEQGYIVEATSSNLFGIRENTLYTPALELGCVNGIMRQQILRVAQDLEFSINENAMLKPEDLLAMDELFLSNAIVGLRYISAFKDRRYFKRGAASIMLLLNRKTFANSYPG